MFLQRDYYGMFRQCVQCSLIQDAPTLVKGADSYRILQKANNGPSSTRRNGGREIAKVRLEDHV